MTSVSTFTEPTFDEIISSSTLPVFVDFWAPWCGPCKTVALILEEIAAENSDQLKVGKINVDEAPNVARRYQVMSIPTLILFRNGEQIHRLVGAQPKAAILRYLSSV